MTYWSNHRVSKPKKMSVSIRLVAPTSWVGRQERAPQEQPTGLEENAYTTQISKTPDSKEEIFERHQKMKKKDADGVEKIERKQCCFTRLSIDESSSSLKWWCKSTTSSGTDIDKKYCSNAKNCSGFHKHTRNTSLTISRRLQTTRTWMWGSHQNEKGWSQWACSGRVEIASIVCSENG